MKWNYAEMCKNAKECGGPEKYAEALQFAGEKTGKAKMIPLLFASFGLGCFITSYFKDTYELRLKENTLTIKEKLLNLMKNISSKEQDSIIVEERKENEQK